nr:TPA_asm: PolB [Parasteatoda house spider adintovirus]
MPFDSRVISLCCFIAINVILFTFNILNKHNAVDLCLSDGISISDNISFSICNDTLDLKYNGQRKISVVAAFQTMNTSTAKQREVEESTQLHRSALDGAFRSRTLYSSKKNDLLLFLNDLKDNLSHILQADIDASGTKWYICVKALFSRTAQDGEREIATSFFRSCNAISLNFNNLEEQINCAFGKIILSFDEFVNRGSGWTLDEVNYLELNTAKYIPLNGSSFIPLPPEIVKKKAVLNIRNSDNKCFLWSVLAALHPCSDRKSANRVNKYREFENELALSGITFPMKLNQISKFEKINNLSINVFGCENKDIFPLHLSSNRAGVHHVNLLLISKGEKQHFCLICDMSRLLSHLTEHRAATFYCNFCLHRFYTRNNRDDHVTYCKEHKIQKITMPSENDRILKFSSFHMQHKIPYIIYADFECILEQKSTNLGSNTQINAQHIPCGYSYVIIDYEGKCLKPPVVYHGENAAEHFIHSLLGEEKLILDLLRVQKPMQLTREEEEAFSNATHCYVCNEVLGNDRVRDHCHLTSKYRGALHSSCNLNFKLTKKIPVVFHNLKGYDSHHIIKTMSKIGNKRISCIGTNAEQFITFSIGHLQFLDSFQFIPASLDKLVSNLGEDEFHVLSSQFSPDQLPLLKRKGVYPYEYFNSMSKFNEIELPPRECFYNSLNEEDVSESDYSHARTVFQNFNMETLKDYHNLYVKTDTLLLADVFEKFRSLCLSHYEIDPAHVFTAPGLAWNACLKMTKVQLHLLTDPTMHLFIEKGVRGGVSMISNRYARANNKYMTGGYDANVPSSYIIYLDKNNLYGTAMMSHLPTKDFRWSENLELSADDILNMSDEQEEGMIIEVDLEYPTEIHDLHSDLPVAPEQLKVSSDMLSPYSQRVASELSVSDPSNVSKLIPNLRDKNRYVLHYRNLKLYLKLGLKMKKIYKILLFKQEAWLQPFINFNTEMRKKATNSFDKDFYKLMNNSMFGKTLENLRQRENIDIVVDKKKALKLIASPSFNSFNIIDDNLVIISRHVTSLVLNRPVYTGFTVLDISKIFMYEFHYNHIRNKYGEKAKLLFTDTDSLCYHIETEDIYHDMRENIDLYDTSDYPKHHFLHSEVNKKVLGKMKDELNGVVVVEFVGLRSKLYSILSEDGEKKAAKGVVKSVRNKKLKHSSYIKCLFENSRVREKMKTIISKNHQLYSVTTNKLALCPLDDKRYILENGCDTFAHGHFRINNV